MFLTSPSAVMTRCTKRACMHCTTIWCGQLRCLDCMQSWLNVSTNLPRTRVQTFAEVAAGGCLHGAALADAVPISSCPVRGFIALAGLYCLRSIAVACSHLLADMPSRAASSALQLPGTSDGTRANHVQLAIDTGYLVWYAAASPWPSLLAYSLFHAATAPRAVAGVRGDG